MASDLYARLAAHFDVHHKDPRGLTYLTGEQVVSRLNEVLGPENWSFTIREHGFEPEADELWTLGRLEALVGDVKLTREQFGSQKHNRRRSDGAILDHGFDLKGASTDALKKCASLIGVGLYLSEKDGGVVMQDASPERAAARRPAPASPAIQEALETWGEACQEADRLKIPHKELPARAPLDQIERWTLALVQRINGQPVEVA